MNDIFLNNELSINDLEINLQFVKKLFSREIWVC